MDRDDALPDFQPLFDAGRYADVIEACDTALAVGSAEFRLHYHKAHAKWLLGEEQAAIDEMSRALNLRPDEPALRYFRGLWLLERADYRSAIPDLVQARLLDERLNSEYYSNSAAFLLIIAHLYCGEFEHAARERESLPRPIKTFALGRLWTTADVDSLIARRARP